MKLYSSKVEKSLNSKPDYIRVLQQIGIHSQPVNRYKIMKETLDSTYVYDIIDTFCPSTFTPDRFLFEWNDVDSKNNDPKYKRKLLLKIKRIYKLKWELPKADDYLNINHLIKLKKSRHRDLFQISHGSIGNVVKISLIKAVEKEEAIITVLDKGVKKNLVDKWLIVKKDDKKGKLSLYSRKYNSQDRWYLDVIMSEKAKTRETNPIIEKYWKHIKYYHIINHRNMIPADALEEIVSNSDCMKIIDNKEYWEYRLNFRGLLFYFIGEPGLGKKRSRIREILSNNLTLEIAPFLLSWTLFDEMGFNVIRVLHRIAQQFQAQIDLTKYDNNYLLRTVAERYFIEVEYFFNPVNLAILRNTWIRKMGIRKTREFLLQLLKYRLFMLDHLKRWTTTKLKEINSNYRIYFEEYKRYNTECSYKIDIPPPSPPYIEETDNNYQNSTICSSIKFLSGNHCRLGGKRKRRGK